MGLLLWLQVRLLMLLLPLLVARRRLLRLWPVLFGLRNLLLPQVMDLLALLRLPLLPLFTALAAEGLAPLLVGTTLERVYCMVLRLRQRVLHPQAVSERIVLLLVGAVLQHGIVLQGALCMCCILLPDGVLCMVACCVLHIGCILMTKGLRLLPLRLLVCRVLRLLNCRRHPSLLLLSLLFCPLLPLLLAGLLHSRLSRLLRQRRQRFSLVDICLVRLVIRGCWHGSCCIAVDWRRILCAMLIGGCAHVCSLLISTDGRRGGISRWLLYNICRRRSMHGRILRRRSRVNCC